MCWAWQIIGDVRLLLQSWAPEPSALVWGPRSGSRSCGPPPLRSRVSPSCLSVGLGPLCRQVHERRPTIRPVNFMEIFEMRGDAAHPSMHQANSLPCWGRDAGRAGTRTLMHAFFSVPLPAPAGGVYIFRISLLLCFAFAGSFPLSALVPFAARGPGGVAFPPSFLLPLLSAWRARGRLLRLRWPRRSRRCTVGRKEQCVRTPFLTWLARLPFRVPACFCLPHAHPRIAPLRGRNVAAQHFADQVSPALRLRGANSAAAIRAFLLLLHFHPICFRIPKTHDTSP